MSFIADHNVHDPVVQALLAVKFDIKRVKEVALGTGDDFVIQACLQGKYILITSDLGIPSQAYLYQFAQNGLTVVQLRWKTSTYKDWQQMVQIILRDAYLWEEAANHEPSIISVSYKRGSRIRPWSKVPPLIDFQAMAKKSSLPSQWHLL